MNLMFMDADEILARFLSGAKTFPDEANFLCTHAPLSALGPAARAVSRRLNPEGVARYSVSKTIVYSNVCQPNCPFCAGTVTKEHPQAFTRSAEEVAAEAAQAVAGGAAQIVLQGGHRLDLPWAYYPGLVEAIRRRCPDVQILSYSPSEIMVFNVAYHKRSADVIGELKAAGMSALLAGGAEGMLSRAPEYRALLRGPWNEWFDVVHRCADARIPVIAPFAFGMGENARERVGHLYRVKAVQERTTVAGKSAFAALAVFPLTPPPGWTPPVEAGPTTPVYSPVTPEEYQRMVALARVLVPTVKHVLSGCESQGVAAALAALDHGADGLAPCDHAPSELERLVAQTGRQPVPLNAWTW